MKRKALLLLMLLALLAPWAANAQSYTFSQGTSASWWKTLSNPTELIAAGKDDEASAKIEIGFPFWFGDQYYTEFWVNSNGVLSFNATTNTAAQSGKFNSSGYNTSQPKICGIGRDMTTGSDGYVKYELQGTSPNRILVVEYKLNQYASSSSTGATADIQWQVHLNENGSTVRMVYSTTAPGTLDDIHIGLGTAGSDFWLVDPAVTTSSAATHYTSYVATTYSTWPAPNNTANRYYLFTPTSNQYVPMYTLYCDDGFTSEYILPASWFAEKGIQSGSVLQSITFYQNQKNPWVAKNLTIKLTNSATDSYGETAALLGSSGTTVYTNAEYSANSAATHTFEFNQNTPFTYTGGSLIVQVSAASGGTWKSSSWFGDATETNQGYYIYGSYTGSLQKFIPKTTFAYSNLLTFDTNPSGNGTIVVTQNGNVIPSGSYCQAGTTCDVTFTAGPGYAFNGWTVSGTGAAVSPNNMVNTTLTMGKTNTTLTANLIAVTEWELGTNTSSLTTLPTYVRDKYSLTQQIYYPEEIGHTGSIKTISFYNSSSSTFTRNMDIYLSMYGPVSFDNSNKAFCKMTGNKVFSGNVTFSPGWNTITFTSTFSYNDIDKNLMVTVYDHTGSYEGGTRNFATYPSTQYCAQYRHEDTQNTGEAYLTDFPTPNDVVQSKNYIKLGMTSTTVKDCHTVTAQASPAAAGTVYSPVGTGASSSALTPFRSSSAYSFVEQVYPASAIGGAGTINSISFYLNTSYTEAQTNDIVLYMKNVRRGGFQSGTDWESVTASDVVYSGSWTIPANTTGWVTINLTTPFAYDGTSNLMVAMDENTDGYSNRNFRYTSVTYSSWYAYATADINPYDLENFTGTKSYTSNRANIQLGITYTDDNTLSRRFADGASCTIGYMPNSGFNFTNWAEEGTAVSTDNPYTFTVNADHNLTANYSHVVEIGNGTSGNYYPLPGYYGWQYDVYIYRPSDEAFLNNDLDISSIAYNISSNSNSNVNEWTIWMKDVDADYVMSNETTFAQFTSGAIQVYHGEDTPTTTGWNTLTFADTYTHEGGKALLVAVRGVGCTTGGGCARSCKYTTATNAHWGKHQDNTDPGSSVAGSLDNSRSNIQLVCETTVACHMPETMVASAFTSTTATLTWSGGSGTYNVQYKKDTDATYTTALSNSANLSISLTNLTPGSNYEAIVQSVCGEEVSQWRSVAFKTLYVVPLLEEFGNNYSYIPADWGRYTGQLGSDGTATLTSNTNWNFGSANNVFDNHAYAYNNGYDACNWLVTPTIEMENNVQLTFDLALTASGDNTAVSPSQQADYRFVVLATTDGGAHWITLREWNNTGSEYVYNEITAVSAGQSVMIDLSSYAGENVALAFYAESTVNDGYSILHIDNVSVDFIPPCQKPIDLTASNITSTSASLGWTSLSSETAWTLYYKSADDADYDSEEVSTNPYTLEGLTPATAYEYYVVANCSASDQSEPSNVFGFTTLYVVPLEEDFTGIDWSNPLVDWSRYTGLLDNGTAALSPNTNWYYGTANNVFDNHAYVYNGGYNACNWLVTPTVEMQNNVQLTFDLALTNSSGDNVAVSPSQQADYRFIVLATTDGGAHWITLREWNNTGSEYVYNNITPASTGQTVMIDLSSYAGENVAVAFYAESTVNDGSNNVHVDNVSIDYIPTCQKPIDLTASNITSTSASLGWTSLSSESAWTVYYKSADDADYDSEEVSTNPYTLEGLTPATAYEYYVVANCSASDQSVPSNVFGFTTLYVVPLFEDFTGADYSHSPADWSRFSGLLGSDGTATLSPSTSWGYSTYSNVFDNHAYVYNGGYNANNWLVTPTVEMQNNVQLTFDLALTNSSGDNVAVDPSQQADYRFIVLVTTDGGAHWTTLREWNNNGSEYVYNSITPRHDGQTEVIDLSSFAGENVNVAFYAESTQSDGYNYLHVDNVSIDFIPSCQSPINLDVDNIISASARLSWTAGGSESLWTVYYKNIAATDYSSVEANTNSCNLQDLSGGSVYECYVVAHCSASEQSPASRTITFATECDGAVSIPYGYGFEQTAPFECWTPLAGAAIETGGNAHEGGSYLKFSGTYSNMVAMPEFDAEINLLTLEFYTRPESCTNTNCGTFNVGYMTDLTDASSFVSVANYSYNDWSDNIYEKKTVTFTNAPDGAYIAFRHNANATNWYWFVDDVNVIYPIKDINYSPNAENPFNGCYLYGNAEAHYGETVEVGVHAADGYQLTSMTYNDGSSDHTITPVSGVYSFTMPAHSVTVSATFAAQLATVTTAEPVHATTTATLGGSWSGGPAATAYGVEYSTDENFASDVTTVAVTTGSNTGYSVDVTGLTPETTYYVRAYVTTAGGTSYGLVKSFATCAYMSVAVSVNPENVGEVEFSVAGTGSGAAPLTPYFVGNQSSTSKTNRHPMNTNNKYTLSEMLYLKDEIGTSGTIKKISFKYAGSADLSRTVEVYMKEVDQSSFYGTGNNWVQLIASDRRFSGTVTATPSSGWVTITLGNDFVYNGTGNLMVAFYDITGPDHADPRPWITSETSSYTCCSFASDSNFNPYATAIGDLPDSHSGDKERPIIKLELTTDSGNTQWYECGSNTQITAAATEAGYYFLNWTDENGDEVSTANPLTLSNIQEDHNLTANFVNYKRFTTTGNWNVDGNWTPSGVPATTDNVYIEQHATIPSGYTAKVVNISGIANTGSITIEDGGQLWHSNDNVTMTVNKSITGYGSAYSSTNKGYYLFSSPISPITACSGIHTSTHYDWYYFDCNSDPTEWIYESHNTETVPFFLRGYIYANEVNTTISVTGTANPSEEPFTGNALTYATENAKRFNGWNLVGNPFVCNAYAYGVDDNETLSQLNYYRLNHNIEGYDEFIADYDRNPIAPMSALMVKATASGQKVKYFREAQSVGSKGILNMSVTKANYRGTLDLARIRFGEGEGLPKFQLNPDHTKLYIPMVDEDYAVVYAEPVGEMPVSFKAEENGQYTLTFSGEEVDFSYLHLIDNLMGVDVDLLETPYYTFSAKTTDYASRFKVVFATGSSTSSDTFAFYSNGTWVIANDGDAILQVVDVTGRVLSSDRISGATSKPINAAPGVYMLRLINGDNVKVQKVVVR